MSLSDEFELIKKIKRKIGISQKGVFLGVGDDAAILAPLKNKQLVTVDCLVENIHFVLKFVTPENIGYKALAVNLSDIAAMGGKPRYTVISLGIREGLNDEFILRFYEGLLVLGNKLKVQVVGGNITRSPVFFASVTVIGESRRPLLRSGAKIGDLVGVTGSLGLAASGLEAMLCQASEKKFPSLFSRQRTPIPRVAAGIAASTSPFVHSLIDVSDGFSSELWHLSRSSKVVIEVDTEKIPVLRELKQFCRRYKYVPDDFIWKGGEDYELIATFDPRAEKRLRKYFRVIGKVVSKGIGVFRITKGRREPVISTGWNHFEK